jgi:hypothetical protein
MHTGVLGEQPSLQLDQPIDVGLVPNFHKYHDKGPYSSGIIAKRDHSTVGLPARAGADVKSTPADRLDWTTQVHMRVLLDGHPELR